MTTTATHSEATDRTQLHEAATLIAAVANNEAKALTLALLATADPTAPQSRGDIYARFMEMQGDRPAWKIDHSGPGQYVLLNFEPAGLVSLSSASDQEAYTLTPYGNTTGLAAAGVMLDLSLSYPDVSLYQIFGPSKAKTVSSRRRSPYTRLVVLTELLAIAPRFQQLTRLARNTGLTARNVTVHLNVLEEIGLVQILRGHDVRTLIRLHPQRLGLVRDVLSAAETIMSGDDEQLAKNGQRAREIVRSQSDVNLLLAKAKRSSPMIHQVIGPELQRLVLASLPEGGSSASELAAILTADGKPISQDRVNWALRCLWQEKLLERQPHGRSGQWYDRPAPDLPGEPS